MIQSIKFWAQKYAAQYANGDVQRLHIALKRAAQRQANPKRIVLKAYRCGRDWCCNESDLLEYLATYRTRETVA